MRLRVSSLGRLDDGLRNGAYLIGGREIDLQPYRAEAEAVIERAVRAIRKRARFPTAREPIGAGREENT